MVLVLEFVEKGNLYRFYTDHPEYFADEKKLLKMFAEICLGLNHIHKNNMIHRDMKPENILISDLLEPKLCDFGWATKVVKDEQKTTFCGTFDYMAPEVFESQEYNSAVDIWSLGIILYELYHGESPFKGKTVFEIFSKIKNKKVEFKENLDLKVRNLIQEMLNLKSEKRPTILGILKTLKRDFGIKFEERMIEEMENEDRGKNKESGKEVFWGSLNFDKTASETVNLRKLTRPVFDFGIEKLTYEGSPTAEKKLGKFRGYISGSGLINKIFEVLPKKRTSIKTEKIPSAKIVKVSILNQKIYNSVVFGKSLLKEHQFNRNEEEKTNKLIPKMFRNIKESKTEKETKLENNNKINLWIYQKMNLRERQTLGIKVINAQKLQRKTLVKAGHSAENNQKTSNNHFFGGFNKIRSEPSLSKKTKVFFPFKVKLSEISKIQTSNKEQMPCQVHAKMGPKFNQNSCVLIKKTSKRRFTEFEKVGLVKELNRENPVKNYLLKDKSGIVESLFRIKKMPKMDLKMKLKKNNLFIGDTRNTIGENMPVVVNLKDSLEVEQIKTAKEKKQVNIFGNTYKKNYLKPEIKDKYFWGTQKNFKKNTFKQTIQN